MDNAKARQYLAQVDKNIEKCEARILSHETRIKKLTATGCDTATAQDTQILKDLVRTMRSAREQFQRFAG